MQIETTRFGALPIDENHVITFPEGLPGFEGCRQFTFIPHPTPEGADTSPFEWLQSVEDGSLAFLAMNPQVAFPHYTPRLPRTEMETLSLEQDRDEDTRVYTLLTVPKGDPEGITANLLAPVVVNAGARLGKQVVLTSDEYGLRHRLIPN